MDDDVLTLQEEAVGRMKKVRIHIRGGTVILPKRHLADYEVTDDIVDVEINDREQVEQLDLVEDKAHYATYLESEEEAARRWAKVMGPGTHIVEQLGGTHQPTMGPERQMRQRRLKDEIKYRYRLVTTEEITDITDDRSIEDAQVIELPEGDQQ